MYITDDANFGDVEKFLGKHGMRLFEIISYFLEKKHCIITEEHLVMSGGDDNVTLEKVIEFISEEIEHYGTDRLILSEKYLWENGNFYKNFRFEFPLGEIMEDGTVEMSDLYAKFSIEDGIVKLIMFDVP